MPPKDYEDWIDTDGNATLGLVGYSPLFIKKMLKYLKRELEMSNDYDADAWENLSKSLKSTKNVAKSDLENILNKYFIELESPKPEEYF